MTMDVMTALYKLEGEKQFDYIFMDPPYGKEWEKKVLAYLAGSDLIADKGGDRGSFTGDRSGVCRRSGI